jgi:hypothetical protein
MRPVSHNPLESMHPWARTSHSAPSLKVSTSSQCHYSGDQALRDISDPQHSCSVSGVWLGSHRASRWLSHWSWKDVRLSHWSRGDRQPQNWMISPQVHLLVQGGQWVLGRGTRAFHPLSRPGACWRGLAPILSHMNARYRARFPPGGPSNFPYSSFPWDNFPINDFY